MREDNRNRIACIEHLKARIAAMGKAEIADEFHKVIPHISLFDETTEQVERDNRQNRLDTLRFLGDNIVFMADKKASIEQKKVEAWIDEKIGEMIEICDQYEAYLNRKN